MAEAGLERKPVQPAKPKAIKKPYVKSAYQVHTVFMFRNIWASTMGQLFLHIQYMN